LRFVQSISALKISHLVGKSLGISANVIIVVFSKDLFNFSASVIESFKES